MSPLAGLDPRDAAAQLLAEHDDAWVDRLSDELDRQRSGRQIDRVRRLWGLSRAELGEMFGVTRQAVSKWLATGVPPDRSAQVADVEAITDLLVHHLKHDRIPAVVRRSAPRLGDQTLLDLVTAGRSSEALQLTREMFTFADIHT